MRKFTDLNEKILVSNLCGWDLSYVNDITGKDRLIPPYVKNYQLITLAEIQNEITKGNPYFAGKNGDGSHALILVENPEVRNYLFGKDEAPIQITMDRIEAMLNAETKDEYIDAYETLIVTSSEAREIMHRWDSFGFDNMVAWKEFLLEQHCNKLIANRRSSASAGDKKVSYR